MPEHLLGHRISLKSLSANGLQFLNFWLQWPDLSGSQLIWLYALFKYDEVSSVMHFDLDPFEQFS